MDKMIEQDQCQNIVVTDLTLNNLFDSIIGIWKNGCFTYQYFKTSLETNPHLLSTLNQHFKYLTDTNQNLYIELEKKIILYSTIYLRELLTDFNSNYTLIKKIDYVIGSQVLFSVLKYIEDHKIKSLPFSNYHLIDNPLCTLVHLILHSRPLKEEDTNRILLKLKGFSRSTLMLVGLFAYNWRRYFEIALNIKGFSIFIERLYKINNYSIINQINNTFSKGEILKINPLSTSDGLVNKKIMKKLCEKIGLGNIKEIISTFESQKLVHYDIIKILKAILEINIKENESVDEFVQIKILGLLSKENYIDHYLELYYNNKNIQYNSKENSCEKRKLAYQIALKNYSLQFSNDYTTFALKIEKSIYDKRQELFYKKFDDKKNYWFQLEKDNQGNADVGYYKKDKRITDHSKIRSNEIYQKLIQECEHEKLQEQRIIEIFERMMCSYTSISDEQLNLILENELGKKIFSKILVINTAYEVGYYNDELHMIYSPIKKEYYPPEEKIKIAHIKDLEKLNLIDQIDEIMIHDQVVEYLPQIYREKYSLTDSETDNYKIKYFKNIKLFSSSFYESLFHLDWYSCFNNDCLYKDIRDGEIRVKLSYINIDNVSLILDELSFDHKTGKIIPIKKIPPIYLSEIIRDIDLSINKSQESVSKNLLGNQNLKKRFLSKLIEVRQWDRVNINENYIYIMGNVNHYKLKITNEQAYYLDEYHEWKIYNPVFSTGGNQLPYQPFITLTEKIKLLLHDDHLQKKGKFSFFSS